ncbi:MAG: hypothetical protein IJD97_05620 [Clostridia bacterium]|nr:hypothetical protein [Clostridia bacterium]
MGKALKVLVEKCLIKKYLRHTNAGDYGSNIHKQKELSGGIENRGSNNKTSSILYLRNGKTENNVLIAKQMNEKT